MHIPDGYLGPQTYVALDVAIVPIWTLAARKVKRTLETRQVPLMALGAAFSFVIMMFNVPVIGGSTGHALGAALVAIILGPWAACLSVSIAVVIQALVFGDGGITAIGANAFNMAVVAPFVGFYVYRLITGDAPAPRRRTLAAGVAGYVSILAAAIVTAVEFGLQPLLAHTASGQPLYAPYPLGVSVPAMALEHLVFFGPIEALVTAGIVSVLAREDPSLVELRPAARPLRWLWAALGVLILLTPLGVLASGTAWGEWTGEELRSALGFVPGGFSEIGNAWTAALPDYAPAFIENPLAGYLFAAVVGAIAVVLLTWVFALALSSTPRRVGRGSRPRSRRGRRGSLASRTARTLSQAVQDVLENEHVAGQGGVLQSLDARVKLVSLLLFVLTASLVHSYEVLIWLVALTLLLAALSRVPVRSFALRVFGSAGLIAAMVAAPAMTRFITPGPALVTLGPVVLTVPGVLGALTLVLRVVASAGFALLVVWTTRWSDLLTALTSMRVPDVLVATLAMTQKHIVSLLRTAEQMHLARESRTPELGSASANRHWVVGRMSFVVRKSVKTADEVYDAMRSRGYAGAMRAATRPHASSAGIAWIAASALLCAVSLWIDRLVMAQ